MILYKYRSLVDPEYTRKMILNREIWFASPNTFIDPFDCFPSIVVSGTKKEELNCIQGILRRNFPEKPRHEVRAMARKSLKDDPSLQEAFDAVDLKEKFESTKVFCLSETEDSILMWSHYANDHKGICLGFESVENQTIFGLAKKVYYNKERYTINWISDGDTVPEKLINAFYEKLADWEYERERRILFPNHRGKDTYKSKELKKIIFGSEISDPDRTLVMSWYDQLEYKPELLQASLHRREYKMEVTPI